MIHKLETINLFQLTYKCFVSSDYQEKKVIFITCLISQGTLLALLISAISYAVFVIFAGGSAMRDASGNITDLVNGTLVGVVPNCVANKVNSKS